MLIELVNNYWGVEIDKNEVFYQDENGNFSCPARIWSLLELELGKYSIVGKASELTEDDWGEIAEVAIHMEDFEHMVKDGWWNYEAPKDSSDHGKPFDTATASGLSLLKSKSLDPKQLLIIKKG